MKQNYKLYFIKFTIYFGCVLLNAQNNNQNNYVKYIDSASNKIDNFPKLTNIYLDSIPEPLDKTIKGRIAEYYHLKAVASNYLSNQAEVYHYNILALKYAEQEKDYDIAGASSLELFYNLYIVNKDSTAFAYLKKAENFYKLDANKNGLAEVMQMKAFVEFYNQNYEKGNALILPKLAYYQSIKDDQYYYMYALFMLTSNYIHLDDEKHFRNYFKTFQTLEKDSTIAPALYKMHKVTLFNCMAERHIEHKALDSALYYLEKVGQLRAFMNNFDTENYYKNYIAYFDDLKNSTAKANYIDSLKFFQENLINKTVDASFTINKTLLKTTQDLDVETKKKDLNRDWIIAISALLLVFIVVVLVRYKKIRNTKKEFSKRKKEYTSLQTTNEKLKAKVKGLEDYISGVKKEVKHISYLSNVDDQRNRIKELYKDIHHNSSTLLANEESHLELINELNVEFFNKIAIEHPELNHSEIIICYYIFTDFKNKEIAMFMNTSLRAIESKRYRISKKIGLNNKEITLLDFLKMNFT